MIDEGTSFGPGILFLGLDLAKELDYEKTKHNQLIASSFSGRKMRDERCSVSFPHFLSLAWKVANDKARLLGWIK